MQALFTIPLAAEESTKHYPAWQFGAFALVILLSLLFAVVVVLRNGRPRE